MKKINFSLVLLCIFMNTLANAQESPPPTPMAGPPEKSSFWSNVFTGGNLGLQFGSQTIVELAPILGYKFSDNFAAGVGIKYLYYKDNYYHYSTDIYGGSVFVRRMILENLFAHAEVEVLNMEVPGLYKLVRRDVTSVFLGGGYRQMIGESSSINILLLYNVNESRYSPYRNPVVRIGFGIGI
ncbi:MAG: hypothetical protein IPG90_03610 [Bacteroidetes bacterium]|nr:hypothetical protein [Bacteroidota bacterium]